jgi:uncharacterized protein YkwD
VGRFLCPRGYQSAWAHKPAHPTFIDFQHNYLKNKLALLCSSASIKRINYMAIVSKIRMNVLILTGIASVLCGSAEASPLAYSFNFTKGWNLIGNSLDSPITVNQAFPVTVSNPSPYSTIWKWNAATSKWAFYTPTQSDGGAAYATSKGYDFLATINPGEGFWVNANSASSMSQTGTAYLLGSSSLLPSWNLSATGANLGAADFNRSLSGVLSGVPANVTTLWAWDAANASWYFYAPNLDNGSNLASYIQSKGYEDFSGKGVTLGNGSGFWVNYPSGAPGSVVDNESKFFTALNAVRAAMGIGQLTRNSNLDQSATAHANYLNLNASTLNSIMGNIDPATGIIYGHSEDTGKPGYLAAMPQARDEASGYTGLYYDEILTFGGNSGVNADGIDAFNGLMNTVYHRVGMLQDTLCDIGIGTTSGFDFVADMGCKVNAPSLASGTLVVFPAEGQVDPYPYWEVGLEVPNPFPLLANGTPIAGPLSVTASTNDRLVTTSFTLTQNGAPVNSQRLDSQNDSRIPANNAFLVPLAPLQLGGVGYTASFTGTINGNSVSKTWSFTTPVNAINASPAGPVTMKNGQTLAISFHAPSGISSWSTVSTLQNEDFQVNYLSSEKIMLTVQSNALTGADFIDLTVSDGKLSGVPPQTIHISVTP